jgi:Skp family chaperone for outer membrane proteins
LMKYLLVSILVLFSISCATPNRQKLPADAEVQSIRYINIQAVFEFLSGRDNTALKLKIDKEEAIKNFQLIEEKLLSDSSPSKQKISSEYNEAKKKLAGLEKDEAGLKIKFLKQINTAVKILAKDMNADFILNLGDEVIFAKKKYDITEDVLREIIKLEKRSDPSVR